MDVPMQAKTRPQPEPAPAPGYASRLGWVAYSSSGESLARSQLFGALRGAHDSFDEGYAQSAFFKLQNAVDGAAGW